MRADLVAALRSLRASATFTAVALLVLALGIGASTAIFSVVDAVVLRGLPFDEHDRLVAVGTQAAAANRGATRRATPSNWSPRRPRTSSTGISGSRCSRRWPPPPTSSVTLREPGAEPEDLRALRATADTFDVLRMAPAIGPAVHGGDTRWRAVTGSRC